MINILLLRPLGLQPLLNFVNPALRSQRRSQIPQSRNLLQHSGEDNPCHGESQTLVRAVTEVHVGVKRSRKVDGVWVGEDGGVVRDSAEIDEDGVAGFDGRCFTTSFSEVGFFCDGADDACFAVETAAFHGVMHHRFERVFVVVAGEFLDRGPVLFALADEVVFQRLREELALVRYHAAGCSEYVAPDELLRVHTGFQKPLDHVRAVAAEDGFVWPDGLHDARENSAVSYGFDVGLDHAAAA